MFTHGHQDHSCDCIICKPDERLTGLLLCTLTKPARSGPVRGFDHHRTWLLVQMPDSLRLQLTWDLATDPFHTNSARNCTFLPATCGPCPVGMLADIMPSVLTARSLHACHEHLLPRCSKISQDPSHSLILMKSMIRHGRPPFSRQDD